MADNQKRALTVRPLSFQGKAALIALANGEEPDRAQLKVLERRGLVQFIPVLTTQGCKVAEKAGWWWPDDC